MLGGWRAYDARRLDGRQWGGVSLPLCVATSAFAKGERQRARQHVHIRVREKGKEGFDGWMDDSPPRVAIAQQTGLNSCSGVDANVVVLVALHASFLLNCELK